MTQKSFKFVRIITAFFLAIIMAQAVMFNNYILAITAVVSGVAVIYVSKKKVKGVLNDERDYAIAGKAARLSLSIFSVAGAMATLIFMFLRYIDPIYEVISSVLAYSVCALLLLYSAIFSFYEKQN
jgi:uncharacterized membrane protein